MSEPVDESSESQQGEDLNRCPSCDSVVSAESERCLMCGAPLATGDVEVAKTDAGHVAEQRDGYSAEKGDEVDARKRDDALADLSDEDVTGARDVNVAEVDDQIVAKAADEDANRMGNADITRERDHNGPELVAPMPELSETPAKSDLQRQETVTVAQERRSKVTFWFTAVFAVVIIIMGGLVLRFQDPSVTIALIPTETPIPPTPTYTPTWTPLPTEIASPTDTPTITPTPAPSDTPQPPRFHTVNAGETLTGLSLRYRVSVGSIAAANSIDPEAQLQVQQNLQIPWPTATPPLVAVAVTVRGVNIIADPGQCDDDANWHEVKGGDTLLKIAAQHDIALELLLLVNRISEETILQQGDRLCIPEIVIGGSLPPTPGPTPTPSPTSPPAGPQLLYPVDNAVIEPPDSMVTLQWAAVKDLTESERYMVELLDLDDLDSLPLRGFTRDTSFQLPASWRPSTAEVHQLRWRVSIILVTGRRSDGGLIYTYGGESSEEAFFSWLGAVPTVTPTPTSTPTSQP